MGVGRCRRTARRPRRTAGSGICYRLWSETAQSRFRPQRIPEILEADLAPLALELAHGGVTEVSALALPDPPPSGALAQAREHCANWVRWTTATVSPRPTGAGGTADPSTAGATAAAGTALGLVKLAADLAALLEERDLCAWRTPFRRRFHRRLDALRDFRRDGATARALVGRSDRLCPH